ncbi:hypothetical protein P3C58_22575 [Mesorhizobium sp. XAP10]|uniref:hypothetical protein n=1 Tax=unclassified Mesorhizobium TaxID=325217 RepID=UPI0023DF5EEF|nr:MULTISPECIES: hypothetical protein [unclassified Mesorhizobium]MDF3154769.1 hypothetical protein [Mesorhizobium sp. XAP10]MDF3247681.1 hypothetical protein [Mesorhizobium sp. XAP4]
MTFRALADSFSKVENLPIRVDDVLLWIREKTDHCDITLHGVQRGHKAYRGAFRRKAVPAGQPYSGEFDIITQILYGEDLDEDWKRLVIVKEALHVFDVQGARVDHPDKLRKLIPAIISSELRGAPFLPAINDSFGPLKAMAVLLPASARHKLAAAIEAGTRSAEEVAQFVKLPEYYVDLWIKFGDEIDPLLDAV